MADDLKAMLWFMREIYIPITKSLYMMYDGIWVHGKGLDSHVFGILGSSDIGGFILDHPMEDRWTKAWLSGRSKKCNTIVFDSEL